VTDASDPIPQITRDDEAAGSGDLVRSNITRLKSVFPEIVTDGKVDFDVLRELLGDSVEEGEERYGLNWKGKRRARAFALTPSLGTLLPAPEESVNWSGTQNIFIEGDNLEALKILRRSYAGRVKLIYIDPPYNTGTDFVYPDNYKNSIANYFSITGQSGANGQILTSRREEMGRLHTDWLNMIYPRIIMAREFLSDDGFIFVSIGINELETLTLLLSDVFGDDNHIGTISWKARAKPVNVGDAKYRPQNENEFVVMFQKRLTEGSFEPLYTGGERSYPHVLNERRYRLQTILKSNRGANRRDTMVFKLKEYTPPEGQRWQAGEDEIIRLFDEGYIEFRDGTPFRRYFADEEGAEHDPFYCSMEPELSGTSEGGKHVLNRLLGENHGFDTVKPVQLMSTLIQAATRQSGSIIMDFFGGSGTTAHAVMDRNMRDDGSRRFILVQLPEVLDESIKNQATAAKFLEGIGKPKNIAEITKERLRRAGQSVDQEQVAGKVDTGFRVYKLAASNLKPWQPDADDLEASILDAVDNVLLGRTEEDLLVELLLKTGIDLTLPEEKRTIAGRTVHALGGGTLMVCLGDVGANDAEALGQGMADWVNELDPVQTTIYFKDTGLGADGNRAATKANLAAILRQRLGDRIAKIASI
jgi:adenine-specific DNA-methyltransferase